MDSIKRIREDSNLKLRIRVRSGPRIRANSGRIRIRANSCEFEPASLMGGPAEAPYAPPRVDPGAVPFVPMFSESIMLQEHTAPAGSMREEHATTDPRSLTVQMSHAAQDPPTTTSANAVYAEEEI